MNIVITPKNKMKIIKTDNKKQIIKPSIETNGINLGDKDCRYSCGRFYHRSIK